MERSSKQNETNWYYLDEYHPDVDRVSIRELTDLRRMYMRVKLKSDRANFRCILRNFLKCRNERSIEGVKRNPKT